MAGCSSTALLAGGGVEGYPRLCNTLVVDYEDEPDETYRRAATAMQAEGFQIKSSDATLRSISSEPIIVNSYLGTSVSLQLSVQDDAIYIRALDEDGRRLLNVGMSGSGALRAFEYATKVAERMGVATCVVE